MGQKLESRSGFRLNTPNYITTPSEAIVSVDYSSHLKILELEWRNENGESKIYHYLNVRKDIYQLILELKTKIDSLSKHSTKYTRDRYSIGRFISLNVRDVYDYYELIAVDEPT